MCKTTSRKNSSYSPSLMNSSYTLSYPSPEPCSPPLNNNNSYPLTNLTPEPENNNNSSTVDSVITTIYASKPVTSKKQYPCPLCHKNFSRPSALQTHSYTHTSEKPFQCLSPGCGRRFSVVSNLRRHFKVHQKPAVINKISSEDRLRCVRQLIETSSALRSKQREMGSTASNISTEGLLSYPNHLTKKQQDKHQQQQDVSSHRYQHYILLPAIHHDVHETNNNGLISDMDNNNQNNNNYLLGSKNTFHELYLPNRSSSITNEQQETHLIPQQQQLPFNDIISYQDTSLATRLVSPLSYYLDNQSSQVPPYYSQHMNSNKSCNNSYL